MPESLVIYTYAACDTCRKAVKWLRAQKLAFTEKPIRERPPSYEELETMLRLQGGELKRLFNTAGRDYRELKLAEKLPRLSQPDALGLLASNGNLIKRPFLLSKRIGLVGFDESVWHQVLKAS